MQKNTIYFFIYFIKNGKRVKTFVAGNGADSQMLFDKCPKGSAAENGKYIGEREKTKLVCKREMKIYTKHQKTFVQMLQKRHCKMCKT